MWSVLAQVWAPLLQRAEGLSLSTRYQTQIQQTGQLRDRDVAQLRGLTQGDLGAVPQARAVLSADTLQLFQKAAANKELEQAKALMAAGRYAEAATVIESVANGEIAKLQRSIQAAADPALARDATEHAADIQEGLRGNLGQLETAIEELAKKLPEAERATLRQALTADDPKRLLGALQQAREAHPELAGDVDGILGTKIDRGIFRTDYSLADLAAAVTAADTATAAAATVAADSVEEYRKLPPDELLKRFTALDRGWTSEDDYAEMRRMAQAADPATRAKMIEQLMSGYTSDDAETCIHDILADARGPETDASGAPLPPHVDFQAMLARVNQTKLYDELDDAELADAKRWVGQAAPRQQTLPNNMPHVYQKAERIDGTRFSNSCGTSSTSMVLKYFFGQENPAYQVQNIDKEIRSNTVDMFTLPNGITSYMEANGLRAGMQSRGTPEDLKNYLDKGIPVTCLIDGSEGGGVCSPHYVVVTGYETDGNGNITNILIDNPGKPTCPPPQSVPVADFMQWWSQPGGSSGNPINLYERVMIVGVPKEGDITLPDGSKMPASEVELPSQSPLALDAHLADVCAGIALSAVRFGVGTVDVAARVGNLFTTDSSDRAAAEINAMPDTTNPGPPPVPGVKDIPLFGKQAAGVHGKFWYLEQCLWGVTGNDKEAAILKLLRNSSPDELAQMQRNLPGGFTEVYKQVADGGDAEKGKEILEILARAIQPPTAASDRATLEKALQGALQEANEEARGQLLDSLAASGTPVPAALLDDLKRGVDGDKYDFVPTPSGDVEIRLKPVPAPTP